MIGLFMGFVLGTAMAAEAPSTPLDVHFHDVTPIKRRRVVVPPWSNLPRPIVCKLDFHVGAEGTPLSVTPAECPSALHSNAVKAGMKWTFEPIERDGSAVDVRFRMVLKINH